jgi:hypothetical protein
MRSGVDLFKKSILSMGNNGVPVFTYHCPERHRVRDLTMKPDVLVGGHEPRELGADNADHVTQHGQKNEPAIEGEHESSAAGCPDGELERVERGELLVRGLLEVLARQRVEWDWGLPGCTIHRQKYQRGDRTT